MNLIPVVLGVVRGAEKRTQRNISGQETSFSCPIKHFRRRDKQLSKFIGTKDSFT